MQRALLGYECEVLIKHAINMRLGLSPRDSSKVLMEDDMKRLYGLCKSRDGRNIIGSDLLVNSPYGVIAIQCKQVSNPSSKRSVEDFIDYVEYLERMIKHPIKRIWATNLKPCRSGIYVGNIADIVWIEHADTDILVANTVSYVCTGRFALDDDGDTIMN
jgi:hypothetical protein